MENWIKKYDYSYYTIQSFPGLADNYTATCFAQSMMLDDLESHLAHNPELLSRDEDEDESTDY